MKILCEKRIGDRHLSWGQVPFFLSLRIGDRHLSTELFREASKQFQPLNDFPKKARNLTIDQETDEQIQSLADQWFSSSNTEVPGNRSDAVNYIIMQYLKN